MGNCLSRQSDVPRADFSSPLYTPAVFLRDVRAGTLQLAPDPAGSSDFDWLILFRRQSRDGSVQDGGAPHVLHLWNQADSVFDAYKQEVKSSINASQVSAQTWSNNQEAPAMNINGHSCVLVLLYSCAVQEISSLLDNTANFEVGHVRYPAAVAWLNTSLRCITTCPCSS